MSENQIKDQSSIQNDEKIKKVKVKLFVFLLIVAVVIIRPYLLDSFKKIDDMNNYIWTLDQKINTLDTQLQKAKRYNNIAIASDESQDAIIWCYFASKDNQKKIDKEVCSELEKNDEIKNNLNVIRNYYLMTWMNLDKMDYDQKLILESIDQFLLSHNKDWLNIVSFWSPNLVDFESWLYELPVSISVDFNNDAWLISFIDNVERVVKIDYPVIFSIDSLNYDILKHEETQTANLTLKIYFYQKIIKK